jgi:surface antigen
MNPPYPCLGVPVDGFCPETPTYPARECTSGCSWWGSQYQGKAWPTGWGNALNWPGKARAAGFVVNTTPAPNTIMCIPPNRKGAGPQGHVAFVTGSPVSGKVSVIEMNFLIEHGYDYRIATVAGCEFIHLDAPPSPTPPEDNDLTSAQDAKLTQLWEAVFGPVPISGGSGTSPPNNIDIIRRTVSPYAKGYPPANPPATPGAP